MSGISPCHHVIDRALEFDPKSSWHVASRNCLGLDVNPQTTNNADTTKRPVTSKPAAGLAPSGPGGWSPRSTANYKKVQRFRRSRSPRPPFKGILGSGRGASGCLVFTVFVVIVFRYYGFLHPFAGNNDRAILFTSGSTLRTRTSTSCSGLTISTTRRTRVGESSEI